MHLLGALAPSDPGQEKNEKDKYEELTGIERVPLTPAGRAAFHLKTHRREPNSVLKQTK